MVRLRTRVSGTGSAGSDPFRIAAADRPVAWCGVPPSEMSRQQSRDPESRDCVGWPWRSGRMRSGDRFQPPSNIRCLGTWRSSVAARAAGMMKSPTSRMTVCRSCSSIDNGSRLGN